MRTIVLLTAMLGEARPLGARVVEAERHLHALFAERKATPESVEEATAHLARLRGQLQAVHLRAHLGMRSVLSAAQRARYDVLRGYTPPPPGTAGPHGHH